MKNIWTKFINYLRIPGIKRRIQRKLTFINAPKIFVPNIYSFAGGWKPAYYYFVHKNKFLSAKRYEDNANMAKDNFILIIKGQKYFRLKMFFSLFGDKNIMNGGPYGTSIIFLLFAYLKKNTLIYTHNGEYSYNQNAKKRAGKLNAFLVEKVHKNNLILCISKQQERLLKNKFGENIKTSVIYNCTGASSLKIKKTKNELDMMMIGSIEKRQGIELYGKLADFAKAKGQKWNFYWMGSGFTNNLYISQNIIFLKYNPDVNNVLKQIDIFFLASIDNPCSLASLEALSQYKKVVTFRDTGTAELVENISGCGIYENYDVNEAYEAIQKVIGETLDVEKVKNINENISSTESLANRLDSVLQRHWGDSS